MNVLDRFLKYVSYDTQSKDEQEQIPSTEKQKLLGQELADELAALGLHNAHMDEHGYVFAWLPATTGCEGVPCMGLISHMDTAPDASGENVRPRIVHYEGGTIVLNEEQNVVLDPAKFPDMTRYVGQDLVVTDGTTLLGADDKAGVAEIVSTVAYLIEHPEIPHGRIAVGFTPDEEVGRGPDLFDVAGFGAAVAYTVDGGALGELEYENFNAAGVRWIIHGVSIHPGDAKDKMKNAVLIGSELISMLPANETPATTEGYEGFYHVHSMEGDVTTATLNCIIREHDKEKFLARKQLVADVTAKLNAKYGEGTVELFVKDQYYNMKEKIEPHMYLIHRARAAMQAAGVEPREVPIRGGTDGARLSFKGLPCPNLCTGGMNFHGVHEYIPVQSMEKMVEVLVALVRQQ